MSRRQTCAVSREALIDHLATGASFASIARTLGLYDYNALRKVMARLGVKRRQVAGGAIIVLAKPRPAEQAEQAVAHG